MRRRRLPHSYMEDFGLHGMVRFVGGQRGIATEIAHVVIGQNQPDFLDQFPAKRTDGAFTFLNLTTGLHEPFGPCLADQ